MAQGVFVLADFGDLKKKIVGIQVCYHIALLVVIPIPKMSVKIIAFQFLGQFRLKICDTQPQIDVTKFSSTIIFTQVQQ